MGGDGPKRTSGESDDAMPSRHLTLWGGSWVLHHQKRAGGVGGRGRNTQPASLPRQQHDNKLTIFSWLRASSARHSPESVQLPNQVNPWLSQLMSPAEHIWS